jgi:hypothetical protein
MGSILAVAVIFLILFLVAQSAGYYRRRLSLADSEVGGTEEVGRPIAVGAGSGILLLLLLALLYVGLTRWAWLGHPSVNTNPAFTPAPVSSPANPAGVGASAAPIAPSPSTKPSP